MKSHLIAAGLMICVSSAPLLRAAGLGKGEQPPSLYELTAHSEVVVAAEVLSGQVKLAKIRVEEVFRGNAAPKQVLQIAFRDFNLDASKKEDRIMFADGERVILFLIPELNAEGMRKGPDRYTLYRGRFGKFVLPREGEEVYTDAMRTFADLASEKDYRKLYSRIRALVVSSNPLLVEVGLGEVNRLDLMDESLLDPVLGYLQEASVERRCQALELLGTFFSRLKSDERTAEMRDRALAPAITQARNDPEERCRLAAVQALGKWNGDEVRSTLEEISSQDSAQRVRYEAKVILLKRDQEGRKSGPSGG